VHSLVKLLALYRGIKFTLISPPMLEMPSYIIEQISRNDHVIEQTHDLTAGLRGADVVYATRIQKERFTDETFEGYTPDFQINQALVDGVCGADTLIMHPLPRDSRPGANDLSVDLNHDSRLAIFRQTDNGIPVRMAIFAVLLGVEKLVQHSMRDAAWRPPAYLGPDDAVFHGID
jgi:aspartate carbamoyltransferase catalytic subunit